MLSPKNRLKNKKDFEVLHQNGDFFSTGNLFLKSLENGKKETRIGFLVGLKFSKKAVERNRFKRQLRQIASKKMEDMKKGRDILVGAQKKFSGQVDSRALKDDFETLLKKARLIIKEK